MSPLQLPPVELSFQSVTFWVLALTILALGIAITFIAFRGYRRNQSRPMLFIAIGFGLILLTQVLLLPVTLFFDIGQFAARTINQLTNIAGMLSILYAITWAGE